MQTPGISWDYISWVRITRFLLKTTLLLRKFFVNLSENQTILILLHMR